MDYPGRRNLLAGIAAILSLGAQGPVGALPAGPQDAALRAVRSFYRYHLARSKDFTERNIRLRKRWLTPELYNLLLGELKREAERSKAEPDEAPYFEGDPLTASQEYPDSFRTGKAEVSGNRATVTVTLVWSDQTSRGSDKRDIVVELSRRGAGWLINDIIDNQGSKLQDELRRKM